MRATILLSALLLACGGDTDDTSENIDTDAFEPAIDEAPSPDRVGTYAHTLPENPSTVIFLGDSITAGVGAPNAAEGYTNLLVNNTNAWPEWDGIDLATRYPGIEMIDVSKSAAWTGDVANEQIDDFESQVTLPFEGEALVIITVGGNDLQSVLTNPSGVDERIATTVENWRKIARYFLNDQRFPDGSTVLMANVYEPTDAVGQVGTCFFGINLSSLLPNLNDANTQLRGLAEEMGFTAMDMRGTFLGHGFYYSDYTTPYYNDNDPSLWMANDCIHPNQRGHHEVRAMFWRGIAGD
ncbi:MAG: SGNH/GDSL hydrolase family protein [Myxococcota bacterium]